MVNILYLPVRVKNIFYYLLKPARNVSHSFHLCDNQMLIFTVNCWRTHNGHLRLKYCQSNICRQYLREIEIIGSMALDFVAGNKELICVHKYFYKILESNGYWYVARKLCLQLFVLLTTLEGLSSYIMWQRISIRQKLIILIKVTVWLVLFVGSVNIPTGYVYLIQALGNAPSIFLTVGVDVIW